MTAPDEAGKAQHATHVARPEIDKLDGGQQLVGIDRQVDSQRHLMTARCELVGQCRENALGSAAARGPNVQQNAEVRHHCSLAGFFRQ